MPIEWNNETYLNATESAKYLGMSFITFQILRDRQQLKSHRRPGKHGKFYKVADLEMLRAPVPEE